MNTIKYKSDYKYQLQEECVVNIPIIPPRDIVTKFVRLTAKGVLSISEFYAWDGPTGVPFEVNKLMRASLVHDALYQLIRLGHLSADYRKDMDIIFRNHLREDGVSKIVSNLAYRIVRIFGNPATQPSSRRLVKNAP